MIAPLELHEPTPEFRAHLEWQIESALRRESRLAAPVGGAIRPLVAALVLVAALATGGVAGLASGRVQDARQRDRLIETARAEENLMRVRVDLSRTAYQDSRRRFEVGAVDRETLAAAERELKSMETSLARIRLDIEEIQMTSLAPRNNLDAPLVGQRDFVRERLALEMATAQDRLATAEQAAAQARQRVEVGTAPRALQRQAEGDVAEARERLQLLGATRDLRQRFLKGEIKAEALAPTLRRSELTLQLEQARREIDSARQRLEEVRRLVDVGQAPQLDLKRSEVDLLEREVEIKRIQQELEMLGTVKR
jgi:hypothetical protein